MINMKRNIYKKNGFVIVKNVLSKNDINSILKMITYNLNFFKKKKKKEKKKKKSDENLLLVEKEKEKNNG